MTRQLSCAVTLAMYVLWNQPVATRQSRPLPVLDMHLHAMAANAQGPPSMGVCPGLTGLPAWDQRRSWSEQFLAWSKKPPCADPVWSPATDDALRRETIALLKRRNIVGVLSGTAELVARWREDAPDRFLSGLAFQIGRDAVGPDDLKALHAKGRLDVLAEVTNQYAGIAADDPRFEPFLAAAEQLDIPVGIHIGRDLQVRQTSSPTTVRGSTVPCNSTSPSASTPRCVFTSCTPGGRSQKTCSR